MGKILIYQMLVRLWGDYKSKKIENGSLEENSCGKFSMVDEQCLAYFKWLGITHIWYTGVIKHSTQASTQGCTASHSAIVKGQAGSPYAIKDYYDLNPYLADDSSRRMEEWRQLIERTHKAGLKIIIDFVPNHVARDYKEESFVSSLPSLGANDDTQVHWSVENDFFYYPGEKLRLPEEELRLPEEKLQKTREADYEEYPAKASGNIFSPSPGINDWYETIKINYCPFHTPTWDKMYDIVKYWAGMGVDGFRCDMVELVPKEFFQWLISKIKQDYPNIIFIAEVYQRESYEDYIKNTGFDYLYDKSGLYDHLRNIVECNVKSQTHNSIPNNNIPSQAIQAYQSCRNISHNRQCLDYLNLQNNMLNFLENHDEQRFASDFFGKNAKTCFAALYTSLMLNKSAFMVYFGQEVGERAMEKEGFSGLDGRSSIFDWWSIDSISSLYKYIHQIDWAKVNSVEDLVQISKGNSVIDNLLDKEQQGIFLRFSSALRIATRQAAIQKGQMYDLCYCNADNPRFDIDRQFAFIRNRGKEVLLIVANFAPRDTDIEVNIPYEAQIFINKEANTGEAVAIREENTDTDAPSIGNAEPNNSNDKDIVLKIRLKAFDAKVLKLDASYYPEVLKA